MNLFLSEKRLMTRGLSVLSSALLFQVAATAQDNADSDFARWSVIARSLPRSPAIAAQTDHVVDWRGPDGQAVHLVVKEPHPRPNAPSVTIRPLPDGADARPAFDAAVVQARKTGAARIVIAPGRYVFRSVGFQGLGQWFISNLQDLTIDGQGATLVFTQNVTGIYLAGSQRIKLSGLTIEFSLPMVGLGRIVNQGLQNALVLDPQYPSPTNGKIGSLSEYDPNTHGWIAGGRRFYFPPGDANAPVSSDNRSFTSPAFKSLRPGNVFLARYQFYGGPAMEIKDIPDQTESEDIVVEGVTIHSAPGMGFVVTRMKRGFALLNSKIMPRADPTSLLSTAYDGVHTLVNQGDILIKGNVITRQADDAININSPVQSILNVLPDGSGVQISNYGRFYRKGDHLAFFDATGAMVAQTILASAPKAIGNGNVELAFASVVSGLIPKMVLRDTDLMPRRFAIIGNTLGHCMCHGVLAQIPHGLISGNSFSDTSGTAIRLITNIGQWKEGVGAFNVRVEKNTLDGIGPDTVPSFPFAAISVYGVSSGIHVSPGAMNDFVAITDNTITNAAQGCISVASARHVAVEGNRCSATNRLSTKQQPITIMSNAQASVVNNKAM